MASHDSTLAVLFCWWATTARQSPNRAPRLNLSADGGCDFVRNLTIGPVLTNNPLSDTKRRGLAHFAESAEQNVPGTIRRGWSPSSRPGPPESLAAADTI